MNQTKSISTSIGDLLRHAGASGAAERGQVHIVSVAPIREAVGERWGRHEPLVEDFVIRSFRRSARDDDFIVRVNEADFILIQPSREPMAALSRASQLMRETLSYFLGVVKAEHIHISIVDRFDGQGVDATRVGEGELAKAALERSVDLSSSEDGSAPWEKFGVSRPPRKVVSIRLSDGADLQAVFFLDPVWNIAQGAVVSFVARTVAVQAGPDGQLMPIAQGSMTPKSYASLAAKRLRFVRELAGDSAGATPGIAVHVPLSFNCLSHSGSRMNVLAELKKMAAAEWKSRLFVEVTDVPIALPHVRLTEIIAQLRPFVRGVLVRLPEGPVDLLRWDRCGAIGMIATVDPAQTERAMIARIGKFAEDTARIGVIASLYGVRTRSLTLAAWAAGVRLLSGDYVAEKYGDAVTAQRFVAEDLYRE
ncbi:hypothetical protein [Brevundimonas sp.]|uniref:hypothetical protein n=1 Tax=Brevundimonas sp. TaxID=1871086 RepID=UPI002D400FBA|nr:hypothetical protein [Brevundimonas sp.]HYD27582.1 hypothetical protein [Brevundimonas sp.]